MANYVKFMRGTVAAYNKLPTKDVDTLYFLSDSDADEGQLYLGTKFIAGSNNDDSTSTKLSDLQDVLITTGLNYDALLIYDPVDEVWKSISFDLLTFGGATDTIDGKSGFVPAPNIEDKNKFLRGDGTWADVNKSKAQIFEIETSINESHANALQRVTSGLILNTGDVAIIKDFIAKDQDEKSKFQYTSYIYNGSSWIAMDGNYSADNVYFKNDFIFTEAVGTIEIPETGNQVVAAAGKNVKQFIESLFAKEKEPEIIPPTLAIAPSQNAIYEVGEEIIPTYEGSYDEGKYEFDATTGVTASEWKATDSRSLIIEEQNGNFDSLTIDDDTLYSIQLQAKLSDGVIPHTNLGNSYTDGQIKESIYSVTSGIISGYRKTFYGAIDNKNEITVEIIRNLSSSTKNYVNGSSFVIDIPEGTMRVIIAYPATMRNMVSVLDENDSNANIVSGFGAPKIIKIPGANGYSPLDYKVYTMDFANPYDTINKFKVTI